MSRTKLIDCLNILLARSAALSVFCIMSVSCFADTAESAAVDDAVPEYGFASECDVTEVDRPEGCAPHAPDVVGRYKVGEIELHIPRQYLWRPVTSVREVDRIGYVFCWPGLEIDIFGMRQI